MNTSTTLLSRTALALLATGTLLFQAPCQASIYQAIENQSSPAPYVQGSMQASLDSLISKATNTLDTLPISGELAVPKIDSLTSRVNRTQARLSGYSDSLTARLDSLTQLPQHQNIDSSPLQDSVRSRLQRRLDRYRQRWEKLAQDRSPKAMATKARLQKRINDLERKQTSLLDLNSSEHIADQASDNLSESLSPQLGSFSEQHEPLLDQSATVLKDTAHQQPSGQTIDQSIDQYAGQQAQLNPLTESAPPNPYESMQQSLEGYQSDLGGKAVGKEEVQQAVLTRLKSLGSDYQQEFAQQLQHATRKLTRQRRKLQAENNQPDTANTRPFSKRLRWGGNFQIHPDKITRVDLSPELHYILLPRWSIALAGVYRVGIQIEDFPHRLFHQQSVFGFRGATEWQALAGWSLRAEWERLRTPSSTALSSSEKQPTHQWINSIGLGIVKYYTISQRMKGYLQLLYNPLHDPLNSPHPHPYVIRLGFQLQPSSK